MLLKNRNALITAGASGMGRATALRFAQEGAHVVIVDVSGDAATSVVSEIKGMGGSAESFEADVRDLDSLERIATDVTERLGALHVLFNNVGVPGAGGIDLTADEWDLGVEVNARGSFFLTSYLHDALRNAQGASVIFTSSTSGLVGSPFSPLYSFAKGGIISLVRSLALAMAPEGIRVNAIAPGSVDTPGLQGFFRITDPEKLAEAQAAFFAQIPLGRVCKPGEIANVAVFLGSDLSSYVTGVTIPVDGGLTAK